MERKFSKQAAKATVGIGEYGARRNGLHSGAFGNTGNAALLFDDFILSLMVLVGGPSWCNGDAYGDGLPKRELSILRHSFFTFVSIQNIDSESIA
jgi:hypothetical protein